MPRAGDRPAGEHPGDPGRQLKPIDRCGHHRLLFGYLGSIGVMMPTSPARPWLDCPSDQTSSAAFTSTMCLGRPLVAGPEVLPEDPAAVLHLALSTLPAPQRRALRLIGGAFAALAVYLVIQSTWVLVIDYHPHPSPLGIGWTAITAAAMFTLAYGKARTGTALGNPVLSTEGRVTLIDGILATAVLAGLLLNALAGWWWADPAAGYVLVFYAAHEVREIFTGH